MRRLFKVCFLPLALLAVVLYVLWLVWWPWPPEPDVDMTLILIPAGKCMMGAPKDDKDRSPSEEPQHEVEVKAFHLGAYEVTQRQYRLVTGSNPSCYSPTGKARQDVEGLDTDEFPVEQVSWYDAQAFCQRLSALRRERAAGRVYRLPTQAEWEYACRAGTSTSYYTGDIISLDHANVCGGTYYPGPPARRGCPRRPTAVGAYPPNPWGLYDMAGNVREWCQDLFTMDYSKDGAARVPDEYRGARNARGSDWHSLPGFSRSAARRGHRPDYSHWTLGFRVACNLRPEPR
jgi:formylglycine-generating enzyme required for sulfatase activity